MFWFRPVEKEPVQQGNEMEIAVLVYYLYL